MSGFRGWSALLIVGQTLGLGLHKSIYLVSSCSVSWINKYCRLDVAVAFIICIRTLAMAKPVN